MTKLVKAFLALPYTLTTFLDNFYVYHHLFLSWLLGFKFFHLEQNFTCTSAYSDKWLLWCSTVLLFLQKRVPFLGPYWNVFQLRLLICYLILTWTSISFSSVDNLLEKNVFTISLVCVSLLYPINRVVHGWNLLTYHPILYCYSIISHHKPWELITFFSIESNISIYVSCFIGEIVITQSLQHYRHSTSPRRPRVMTDMEGYLTYHIT